MKKLSVKFFSDYACPFCYIGETHLKRAIQESGLENDSDVTMLSFELDPTFPNHYVGPSTQLLASKYGISLSQASEEIKKVEAMANDSDIALDYVHARYTSTFPAHRLTKLAQEKLSSEKANQFIDRLFQAMFEEHREMSDLEALKPLALEAGISEEDFEQLLNSDDYSEQVRSEEALAKQYGVNAVPYFIINDKYAIPGALPTSEMKKIFNKILEEDQIIAEGAACGVDGCK